MRGAIVRFDDDDGDGDGDGGGGGGGGGDTAAAATVFPDITPGKVMSPKVEKRLLRDCYQSDAPPATEATV